MDKIITDNTGTFSRIREKALSIFSRKQKEDTISPEKRELLGEIESALSDLRYARSCFAAANDPAMIEASVYEIKSAEARYSFLLRKAKLLADREKQTAGM